VGSSSLVAGIASYIAHLPRETLFIGVAAAAVGIHAAVRDTSTRTLARVLGGATLGYLVVFHHFSSAPVREPLFHVILMRFWPQANLVLFAFAGVGFARGVDRLADAVRARGLLVGPSFEAAWPRLVLGLALVFPILQGVLTFPSTDRHRDDHVQRYGSALLDPLPRGSMLVVKGDLANFALRYMQSCEKRRLDVNVVAQEALTLYWHVTGASGGAQNLETFFKERVPAVPVFTSGWIYLAADRTWEDSHEAWSLGFLASVRDKKDPPDADAFVATSERSLALFTPDVLADLERFAEGTWEQDVLGAYWRGMFRHGAGLVLLGLRNSAERRTLTAGIAVLDRVIRASVPPPPMAFKFLGIAHATLGDLSDPGVVKNEHVKGMEEAWRRYLQLADPGDSDLPKIRARLGLGK
jgi:hypothetical protein